MIRHKPRYINFIKLLNVNEWKIKIYTISETEKVDYSAFYNNVKVEIPKWLEMKNSFNSSNDKIGFIILHFGTEGIFTLVNIGG